MREIIITLITGQEISGTETPTGEIWSPLGHALTSDMIARVRPDTRPAE